MRVPLSWLRERTPVELDVDELTGVLDGLGLAVESVERVGARVDGVVVATVVEVGAIEGADRIRRVTVDAGAGPVPVVCGAWNFAAGDLVPLATVGAVLPGGLRIGRRRMKGVTSEGMLCASDELGLPGGHDGILVLPSGLAPGTPVGEALGLRPDVVLELEVNANRPDVLSVAGVARDVAARLGLPFSLPEPALDEGPGASAELVTVAVDEPERCGRFVARVVTDVVVGPSPPWLANRVALAGMRPINNVVDASNYVMLELGEPNHPYDLDRLPGRGLRVRLARPGETLVTLDDVERKLTPDDLLICDAEDAPVGIAGVMGGAAAEIAPDTSTVVLEAAWFDPATVARSAKRLNLRTEASARFERGCDPNLPDLAARRFCELLAASGATPAAGAVDVRGRLPDPPRVRLRTARVNAVLGTALGDAEVAGHLRALGFAVDPLEPGRQDVTIPSWRPDSAVEIDLVEEVARLHGYEHVERTLPSSPHIGGLTPYQRARRLTRSILTGAGLSEAWTPSFVSSDDLVAFGLPVEDAVRVVNPLVADDDLLRTCLLPGLVGAVAHNESRRNRGAALFEIGHVFRRPPPGQQLPDEFEALAFALAGCDATEAVAVWWALAEGLGVREGRLAASSSAGLHPTRTTAIALGGEVVGVVSEVDPDALERVGVGVRVAWLELDLGRLLADGPAVVTYRPVSRYPSSDVDLAFEVDEVVPAAAVEHALRRAGGDLVAEVRLFDVYRGLGAGRRSLAYAVRFQADDRTLTDEEVAAARRRLIEAVEGALPATLR
jgi:phenylalanyl-tRNA synthetase beta chain